MIFCWCVEAEQLKRGRSTLIESKISSIHLSTLRAHLVFTYRNETSQCNDQKCATKFESWWGNKIVFNIWLKGELNSVWHERRASFDFLLSFVLPPHARIKWNIFLSSCIAMLAKGGDEKLRSSRTLSTFFMQLNWGSFKFFFRIWKSAKSEKSETL